MVPIADSDIDPSSIAEVLLAACVVTMDALKMIEQGRLDDAEYRTDELFGFDVPLEVPGVVNSLLDPRSTWRDPDAYDRKARELARMFRDNFEQFASEAGEAVVAAGPRLGGG